MSLVLFVVCAVVLGALWQIHRTWDRPPPDVGAFARSAATRSAGADAAREGAARLGELRAALPWAVPVGTSVADSCRTLEQGAMFGPRNWSPIRCTRNTVLYLAFDGDIRTRLRQLDAVLAEKKWAGTDAGRNTLTAMATWLSEAGGDASPSAVQRGSTEPPGSRPICLSTGYVPAAQAAAPTGAEVGLQAAVAERPCPPEADTGDLQLDGPPRKSAVEGTYYVAWHPLWTRAVSRSAYADHRYLVAFSLVDTYAAQPGTGDRATVRP
ncbi:hypothetical protein [Actinacidiphila alni]|uniref:hypothetical protein n=1 Tax=Actinacidiphila alni TaxID=380248 RepID=UPI001160268B|nr:hypothetical protein [Actinacidiphila alni]